MDWKIMEDMFIIMVESNVKQAGAISCHGWNDPLIINDKKIDDIFWDGDNFNLIWYNEFEEPEPLEYYKKDITIKPCKNIFIYLFGDR